MHHGKKIYKTAPKKQHRQIIGRNVIPSLKMKTLHEKKAYDAEHLREVGTLIHEADSGGGGGPVEKGGRKPR